MQMSENLLKWLVRFYPPLFLQRIWVVKFHKGFRGVEIKIRKSIWNRNYNNSIFGGTIFAAADAFYPILFYKALSQKGYKLRAWSTSSYIEYHKPGFTDLFYEIYISDDELNEAKELLDRVGRYRKSHPIEIYNKSGINVASVMNEIYMRNINFTEKEKDADNNE